MVRLMFSKKSLTGRHSKKPQMHGEARESLGMRRTGYVGLVRIPVNQLARTPVDQLTRKQANQSTGQQRMRWTFLRSHQDSETFLITKQAHCPPSP